MNYVSTRGIDKDGVSSAYAIKTGLAKDGGLYMPESIPTINENEIKELAALPYTERAAYVLSKFLTDYTYDELLADAEDMIEDLTYAGTGITIVEDAYAAAAPYYTIDENGNAIADSTVTRAQLIPIMTNLDYALVKAQEAIDNVHKGQ